MERKKHTVRNLLFAVLGVLLCAAVTACAFFGIKGYGLYSGAIAERPLDERVEEIRGMENFTPYSKLPDFYIKAVISVEDHRFEKHCGIDPVAICRALWIDIKTLSPAEGGSTITQQVAKNMLFTQEKKLERKAAEVFAAFALEAKYEKSEIFELYVNMAYFGSGYYGIHDAAAGYYNKLPSELTDYESAVLAGLLNAPSAYSPNTNPKLAKRRAAQVIKSMVKNGFLTQARADEILSTAPKP